MILLLRLTLIGVVAIAVVATSTPYPHLLAQSLPNYSEVAVQKQERIVVDFEPKQIVAPGLPNPIWVHPEILSGGLPDPDAGFRSLHELGIRTILSVDGIVPRVETAKIHGMRYVHLPHGYDGISEGRLLEITKAIRDLPRPIYIHCHHGRHRSPAAAAAGAISAGLLSPDRGIKILNLAGTNPAYRGLFEVVSQSRPISDEQLNQCETAFPEISEVEPLAHSMVAIDAILDTLKSIDLDRSSKFVLDQCRTQALLLKEQYIELARSDEVAMQPTEFKELLQRATQFADDLQSLSDRPIGDNAVIKPAIERSIKQIQSSCLQCHQQFRDNPQARNKH